MDPVDQLAPLAMMELRYVFSCARKQWNLTRCSQSLFYLILMVWLIIELINKIIIHQKEKLVTHRRDLLLVSKGH